METVTLIVPVDNELHLQTENGQVVVSSRVVTEKFGKQHKHVLDSIEELIKGVAEKSADLFIPSQYQHPQNKQWYPEYLLTRDGFTLLAIDEMVHHKYKNDKNDQLLCTSLCAVIVDHLSRKGNTNAKQ